MLIVAIACASGIAINESFALVEEKRGVPQDEATAVAAIRSNSKAADVVVSDQQMQVFRSGRSMPAALCDTSFVRIQCGYLTDDDAIEASRDAKVIIFWTGRLAALKRYEAWVAANYRPIESGDREDRKIYVLR